MTNIIYKKGNYRILEVYDNDANLDDLKGDCYDSNVNTDIELETLKYQEKNFEMKVQTYGVFGYILEKWDSNIDHGWIHVDSCFGLVGKYEDEDHYIVNELIELSELDNIDNYQEYDTKKEKEIGERG